MLKTIFSILLLLLTLSVRIVSASDGYLQSQAYFEDTTNALTLEQVRQEKFTAYEGWLSQGYRPSTYWIKLDVRPSDKDLVLRVRPAYVESVQLFDALDSNGTRVTGSKYRASDAEVRSFNHGFYLGANTHERVMYLKVKSVRTYLLNFEVMPLSDFLDAEHTSSLILVAYIVFVFSLGLWLLGAWLSNREIVLGMFVVQQFISFCHVFFLYGYARILFDHYIDQSVINYFTYLSVVVYPVVGVLANKLLFREYGLKRFYAYLFNGAIGISICVVAILIFGNPGLALKINALLVILAAILFWVTSLFGTGIDGVKNTNLPINILRMYFTFNLLMWAMVVFPALGVAPSNELAAHSNIIYSTLSGLIFCWILQYRAKFILKNEALKSAALKEEVENERIRREEQGKLMSMLTHEIRTPLSVLKLVVDRKVTGSDLEDYANRAVNNIDSIIDKCIQLDRLELNVLQVNKSNFNFLVLLNSIISDGRLDKRFLIHGHADVNVESDPDIVSIIVSNLLGNAIKYSAPGTDIDIRVDIYEEPESKCLQFSVQNKIGSMGAPDPELAFEKYYRSPAASKISGSGLGLFLVRELVHALQGEVKLSVNDNQITFTVWIPI